MNRTAENPPEPRVEERMSVIVGDRLCTGCNYNLTGQPVIREPEYGLLVARCPECGAVACLEEYPVLGRWGNRWVMLIAATWFVTVVVFALASLGAVIGTSIGFTWVNLENYDRHLQAGHQQWIRSLHPDRDTNQWWMFEDFSEWWAQIDPDSVFAQAGGWTGVWSWSLLTLYLIPMGIALLAGTLLAIAMVHQSRARMSVLAGALAVLGAVGVFIVWRQLNLVEEVDRDVALWLRPGIHLFAAALTAELLMFVLGLMCGRPFGRVLVRALLPPRLRVPLAVLWTADGRTPPIPSNLAAGRPQEPLP